MRSYSDFLSRCCWRFSKHLNFYRVHLLFFTFTPLIFSVIFYLSNGRYKVAYVDCLFNCVSAMTVCGLATINLSELTPFQQAILFFLMSIGSPVTISWVMVFVRRHYFAKKFEHLVLSSTIKRSQSMVPQIPRKSFFTRLKENLTTHRISIPDQESVEAELPKKKPLRTDMIRRMDDAPQRVDPNGWLSQGASEQKPSTPTEVSTPTSAPDTEESSQHVTSDQAAHQPQVTDITEAHFTDSKDSKRLRRISDPGLPSRPPTPPTSAPMLRSTTLARGFPRTHTVEFAPTPKRPARTGEPNLPGLKEKVEISQQSTLHGEINGSIRNRRGSTTGSFHATPSIIHPEYLHGKATTRERGFGGFPSPWGMLTFVISRLFPSVQEKFSRTLTIPATTSFVPGHVAHAPEEKAAPYLSFGTVVGRNSAFHRLTKDQLAEVGGVEYRALNVLMWLVPVYHFGFQIIGFIVIGAYTAQPRWASVFDSENQVRPVNSVWFSAYQVVSAYTNTGTSLVDQSMLPFQRAYPVILIMALLILAGNTCFVSFQCSYLFILTFLIWTLTKFVSKDSLLQETLTFLLHHPRRCFIYLFPSHQTWFLLSIVVMLTLIDWVAFLVLDINNHVIEMIPVGIRVVAGFLQGISVRAAGFGIIPLAAMAPAVKVLYVIMMYISVYPVAMSVRSTNVYEERSLGVFPLEEEDEETNFQPFGDRLKVWSRYLALHARKQLAFDMWWLALFLFLICCAEAARIDNPANATWFNIFNILFELVSAYGTVGLSLGIPDQNYSLSGAFTTFSKIVVCVVMLRGRHRGLPMSIDRAIMFPSEFSQVEDAIRERKSLYSADGDAPLRDPDNYEQHEPFVYSETMTSARASLHRRFSQNGRLRRPGTHDDLYSVAERGDTSSNEGRLRRQESEENDNLKEY
ncbi:cation transport protein-domain-containing protein [Panaeolus papilionaceus]|nr:cation transport protein-domain-containing protein [Panaeolus papilionaceus]